jgi:hypothetical protein
MGSKGIYPKLGNAYYSTSGAGIAHMFVFTNGAQANGATVNNQTIGDNLARITAKLRRVRGWQRGNRMGVLLSASYIRHWVYVVHDCTGFLHQCQNRQGGLLLSFDGPQEEAD